MKNIYSLVISLLLISLSKEAITQPTIVTKKITVKDSIKIGTRFVTGISNDPTLAAASNKKLPTEYAVKTYMLGHITPYSIATTGSSGGSVTSGLFIVKPAYIPDYSATLGFSGDGVNAKGVINLRSFGSMFNVQLETVNLSASRTLYLPNESDTFATQGYVQRKIFSPPGQLIDGPTITWNLALTTNDSVTLAGNRTLVITNPIAGMYGTLVVKQDATGSRTLALPANVKVINGGAGAITLTTTAGAKDVITFYYDGAYFYFNFGLNYN